MLSCEGMPEMLEEHENQDRKPSPAKGSAGKVVSIYAVVALVWIFASDHLVAVWSADIGRMKFFSSLKGAAFVAVTSLLLLVLIRRLLNTIDIANLRLRDLELREKLRKESVERERRLDGIGQIAAGVAHEVAAVLEPIRVAFDRASSSGGYISPRELDHLRGLLDRGATLTRGMVEFGSGTEALGTNSTESGAGRTENARSERTKDPAEADLLVLENETVIRVFVQEWLETFGYRVVGLGSEAEVRSFLHTRKSIPRSVVVDWCIGGTSPESVLGMLRERHPGLVAVAMSGREVAPTEMDRLGIRCVLQKPFSGKELLEALRRAGAAPPQGRTEGFQRGFLEDMSTE